jgi:hypothetical protein
MKNDSEEKPLTTEELFQENKRVSELWFVAERKCHAENEVKRIWMFIALGILCVCLYKTKTSMRWLPDLEDGIMRVEYSNWWGFKTQKFYPVWRKPTGEDFPEWCIKYPDGTWHVFEAYDEAGQEAWVYFPPKQ